MAKFLTNCESFGALALLNQMQQFAGTVGAKMSGHYPSNEQGGDPCPMPAFAASSP